MTDLVGKSLGRYHILEQLGEGGMAIVYKALDTKLERHVAIKVIHSDHFGSAMLERILMRFKKEAKALAKISHPNIVKVMDYGDEGGVPYLVMEYLPGGTLKQKMNGKPMPWRDAARLLLPVCRALGYAHEEGIIHRDIKPSNIMLSQSGEPMLTDFGIAKIISGEEDTADLTGTGVGIGTADYMAPEQGVGNVDKRVDIYALGVVYYQMVTGRLPYKADTPMAVMLKKNTEPLPSPRQFVPNLPYDVGKALIKALQKDAGNRYQSVGGFCSALEKFAEGTLIPSEETQTISLPKRIFIPSLIGILGLLGVIGIFLFVSFILRNRDKEHTPPTQGQGLTAISTPGSSLLNEATALPPLTLTPEDQWSGILSVRIPTLNEIRADVPLSLWDANQLNVIDIPQPGMDAYFGEAYRDQEYLFPGYWCATSPDLLARNMEHIETVFKVNGEVVPNKFVFSYNYDTNNSWNCTYHAIVLGGWAENSQYVLEIRRTLLFDMSDGQSDYSAGDYVYRLTVTAR